MLIIEVDMTDELMLPGQERLRRDWEASAAHDAPGPDADFAANALWPKLMRAYVTVADAVADCARGGNSLARTLDARFQSRPENLRLAADDVGPAIWTPAPERSAETELARRRIGAALDARFDDPDLDEDLVVALAEAVLDFLVQAQSILRLAADGQREGGAHDILQEVARRRLGGLLDEIEACFGLAVTLDAGALSVTAKPMTEPWIATAWGA